MPAIKKGTGFNPYGTELSLQSTVPPDIFIPFGPN